MPEKYSKEKILNKIREKHGNNIEIVNIDNLIDCQTKTEFRCNICGNIWLARPYSIIAGHGCRKCYNKRNSEKRIISLDIINEKLNKSGCNAQIIRNYIDTRHYAIAKCNLCDNEWETSPRDLINGHGCPKCNDSWINKRKTKEEFIKEMNELYHGEYTYLINKKYVLTRDVIEYICPVHGKIRQKVNIHIRGNGCKFCRESGMEKKIRFIMEDNNVFYISQYKPKWLELLSYDFYLPNLNIAIECQGIQHFLPVETFGGEEELLKTIERDKRKKMLSKKHNISLIYFLDKSFNSYMEADDIYFNKKEDLLKYIQLKLDNIIEK